MSIEKKQDDLMSSLHSYLRVRSCYSCQNYYQKDNKCNEKHVHLPKVNCNEHKFKLN